MIYVITFLLAYCSIIYELVMAQSLSAFLGNTVLRYSTTVGLYLASMGAGAILCRGNVLRRPNISLIKIEVILSAIGGFCVAYLHIFNMVAATGILFTLFSHTLIIIIGILSGFEVPLLVTIKGQLKDDSINPVLGVNYFGALVGAVAFPLFLLPSLGILLTTFITGILNAIAGLLLISKTVDKTWGRYRLYYAINLSLLVALIMGILFSSPLEGYFMAKYLAS